jgi:hypothetical protein
MIRRISKSRAAMTETGRRLSKLHTGAALGRLRGKFRAKSAMKSGIDALPQLFPELRPRIVA